MALNKQVRNWLLITVSIGIAVNVGVRIHLATSDSYKTARQHLMTNPIVVQKLGEMKSTSLSFTGPSKIEFGSGNNSSEMSLSLEGTTDSAEGHVTLKQNGEVWAITDAYLRLKNGTQVNLR